MASAEGVSGAVFLFGKSYWNRILMDFLTFSDVFFEIFQMFMVLILVSMVQHNLNSLTAVIAGTTLFLRFGFKRHESLVASLGLLL